MGRVKHPESEEWPGSVPDPSSDGRFRAMVTHSAVGTALVGPDGAFLFVNAALCTMLGRSEKELTACTWQELTHPDDLDADIAFLSDLLEGRREAYRRSKRYQRPDGEVVFGDLSVSCIRGPEGEVDYFVAQIVDVTEETAIRDRYQLLAENATDVVALGDNAGVLKWVSPSVMEILGWGSDQIQGKPFMDLVHEDDRPTVAAVQADLLQGRWASMEVRMRRADGSSAWMDIRLKPVLDSDGTVVGRVASWRTAVTRVERERFRAALDAELDAHVFVEAVRGADGAIEDLLYVDANGAATDYVRLSRDELLGTRLLERFPGQRASGLFARYVDAIETGDPLLIDDVQIESEISGGTRHIAFRGVKVGDGLSLTWRDVTESVTAAQALAESEARFQLLAENASDIVFEGDRQAILQWVSPSVREVLGVEPADLVGSSANSLIHPDDLPQVTFSSEQIDAGQRASLRARYRRADGAWRWADVLVRPILDADGDVIARVGSVRDIHEQVLAERAVAAAEERYRSIAETVTDVVMRARPDGVIDWVFGATEALIGRTPDELIGTDARELFLDEERENVEERMTQLLRGETLVGTVRVKRADGGTRWVSRRTRAIFSDDGAVDYLLTSGSDAQAEVEFREALAESERQALDLAERFEVARNEALEANLAKTSFLSSMSHELRTPLNAVLGFAQLLEMDPLTDDQRESVAQIRTGGQHLLDLISEILDISRIEAGRLSLSLESVIVADAVSEALDLVRPLALDAKISLMPVEGPSPDAAVWADRQRVIQILLNLLSNAVKYTPSGGSVTVAVTECPGGEVAINVTDTGVGISAANQSRLFIAFDRLGAEATSVEGTGIGLTLSQGLARAMHGRIEVTSVVGEGSAFTLVLPPARAISESTMDLPAVEVVAARGGPVRVLYVEDNPTNAHLMSKIIALRSNASLTVATSAAEGIRMALEEPPDLVFLDLHLPDMRGEEVLRRLRSEPVMADVPIVAVTADAAVDVRRKVEELGADGFLTKPVEVVDVLAWIDHPRQHGGD